MEIKRNLVGEELTLTLEGRLDTTTAPLLEQEFKYIGDAKKLIFDFTSLEYISSSGLRVLLQAHKLMKSLNGSLVIRNVVPMVAQVFEITGFYDILDIQ